jgi:hypothetical protein
VPATVEDPMKTPIKANPNDTDEVREAIEILTSEGISFFRPTKYQLKIGELSFYPDTGRIFRDGESTAWEQRGLNTLISHVQKLKQPKQKVVKLTLVEPSDSPPIFD